VALYDESPHGFCAHIVVLPIYRRSTCEFKQPCCGQQKRFHVWFARPTSVRFSSPPICTARAHIPHNTHTCTHTQTHTYGRTQTRTQTHARTHARMHADTPHADTRRHAHIHTHTCACARAASWWLDVTGMQRKLMRANPRVCDDSFTCVTCLILHA